ncbi:hypothetical protein JOL79_08450 [Microbispora sp. RL4-1S]|uniref:Uncharacterized protein n=1 Tax=Microbispora oryzae TaxID=2806554 RepID=A0A940WDZ5_9ACTN|nr:hypothetical protein [Microbispora oryzae]MBP2703834.1 hypothetical protein [Microbispora oryzae]
MSHDPARSGRTRRLVLTLAPPVLMVLVPLVLVAGFGGRLPARAFVEGASPQYASTWSRWVGMHLYPAVLFGGSWAVFFHRYWNWPELQRLLATLSMAFGVSLAVTEGIHVLTLVGAHGPVPTPGWAVPAEVTAAAGAALAGWRLSGPLPPPPEAGAAPPPGAPVLSLAPGLRAVYAASTLSRRRLLYGLAWLALAGLQAAGGSSVWQGATFFAVAGVAEVLQARTRLRIDAGGVEVALPWFGGLRRIVPFTAVAYAEALPAASGRGLGLFGSSRGWGFVSGPGPVLALKLTEGRPFLYSTRDAGTAAALVNGMLSRIREDAGRADRR